MKFSQSRIGSIIGGVIISIFLIADWTACLAQEGQANASEVYLQVYEVTQSVLSHDPVNRSNMLEKALFLVK